MMPTFPTLDRPISEDRFERIIEKIIDHVDLLFIGDLITKFMYDKWFADLKNWEKGLRESHMIR